MRDLEALIAALVDLEDTLAPRVLADALAEAGDARAEDVRLLADVVPVIPLGSPDWYAGEDGEVWARWPDSQPMACGPWWWIGRTDCCVHATLFFGTAQWARAERWWPDDPGRSRFELPDLVPLEAQTESRLLLGFERCRRLLLAVAVGRPMLLEVGIGQLVWSNPTEEVLPF